MKKLNIKYPRRKTFRSFLHQLSRLAFWLLANVEIIGEENIPKDEPLIIVANHFNFADPVAFVRIFSWKIEFVGGAVFPHAPQLLQSIPKLWGYYSLYRGTGSRDALRAAEGVIKKGGLLGIFPEGGNWAEVLRPPRPGTAYLASITGARILPVGLSGLTDIFPLKLGKRPKVKFKIGAPFYPPKILGRGRERRENLDEFGHEIMRHIAELLPPEKRGSYSEDPELRAVAKEFEAYPWEGKMEGEVIGEVH
ncbi:MAG: 1-acyl-sn-glycerol-3-phosphate acyltransferase [Anaerolineae bacterium]|nr:1-acyl-sn-glycerol-3-phosphate acyltransferase [Anaerolineae bacterium]MBT7075420.1 1-acyl-sn-glycerol-3-phosphate acyltransferase [Anaerolineae bacterium]MBT7782935.1 1-acyl-sn-glycerol-3-phosphate acyltransferase [Anaerolineae bacterium]